MLFLKVKTFVVNITTVWDLSWYSIPVKLYSDYEIMNNRDHVSGGGKQNCYIGL